VVNGNGGEVSTKSPSSSVQAVSHYGTPVGVISGLILFRLVAFGGRSAMGWSVPFSWGEFLVEGPLQAGNCLWLLFFLFSLTAYAAAGETSRAMRLALLISATRRS